MHQFQGPVLPQFVQVHIAGFEGLGREHQRLGNADDQKFLVFIGGERHHGLGHHCFIVLKLVQLHGRVIRRGINTDAGGPVALGGAQGANLLLADLEDFRVVLVDGLLHALIFIKVVHTVGALRNHEELMHGNAHFPGGVAQGHDRLVEHLELRAMERTSPSRSGVMMRNVWLEMPTMPSWHSELEKAEA